MKLENSERARMLVRTPRTGTDEPAIPVELRHRAARRIASEAVDAAECAELLDMLGLTAEDGIPPVKD